MRTQKTVDFSPVNVLASEGIISQYSLIGGFLYGGKLIRRVDEVCQMLTVSRAEAYRIIKRLNAELCGIRTDRKAEPDFNGALNSDED